MSDISPAGTLFRHTLRVTLQGIFTLALTLLGLLVITFALSALSPVDRSITDCRRSRQP